MIPAAIEKLPKTTKKVLKASPASSASFRSSCLVGSIESPRDSSGWPDGGDYLVGQRCAGLSVTAVRDERCAQSALPSGKAPALRQGAS